METLRTFKGKVLKAERSIWLGTYMQYNRGMSSIPAIRLTTAGTCSEFGATNNDLANALTFADDTVRRIRQNRQTISDHFEEPIHEIVELDNAHVIVFADELPLDINMKELDDHIKNQTAIKAL